jgi:acetyl-CoA acyltransferase
VLTAHDPRDELLLGPVFAIPRALEASGVQFGQVHVFELHEAFAAQVLAVRACLASRDFAHRHLGREEAVGVIPTERLNAWGGSLALGNPFAPNGARLLTTAVSRLEREGGHYGVVATCAGGALGHGMLVERLTRG